LNNPAAVSAVTKNASGYNNSHKNSDIAMTKADSPKSERPRSSLGRSDSYRRAKPILSPPEARKTGKDKMAPMTVHDLDISAIKVVDEKVKENSPPPIIGDDLLHQKPTNNFFKNIRSQFSFSSLRIKKSAKKGGSEPKSSKQQLGDSYRTSGCDPSNDLKPLASITTTKTPNSNGNGCLNGTGLNGVSPRNGGIGPKATSTPLSGCAGGLNDRSSTSPDADGSKAQAPPEMRRFRTAAVKNQYQRWSFAEQQMNHQQHPAAANGHHYPPSAVVGPYYGGGQLYHHAVPPQQLYGPGHPYMVHNGHYNGQMPSHHILPNGQVVAFTGHPAINGGYSGRPSPVNGQLGHHFGTYGPSSSRDSAGTRRSSLASLIGGNFVVG
jgi:hypothetical protein